MSQLELRRCASAHSPQRHLSFSLGRGSTQVACSSCLYGFRAAKRHPAAGRALSTPDTMCWSCVTDFAAICELHAATDEHERFTITMLLQPVAD